MLIKNCKFADNFFTRFIYPKKTFLGFRALIKLGRTRQARLDPEPRLVRPLLVTQSVKFRGSDFLNFEQQDKAWSCVGDVGETMPAPIL